jgi:hypothetical protein
VDVYEPSCAVCAIGDGALFAYKTVAVVLRGYVGGEQRYYAVVGSLKSLL